MGKIERAMVVGEDNQIFFAGDRQVKGVPLNLQMFLDPEAEDLSRELYIFQKEGDRESAPIKGEKGEDPEAFDALRYAYDSTRYEVPPLPFEEKPDPMNERDYMQLVEFQKEEIRKLKRERDLWKFVSECFYDRLSDAHFNSIKEK